MLKKTIKYTDFNDEEVEEDFFFHISQAELVELQIRHKEGMSEWLQNIIKAEDAEALYAEFKKIIVIAYGKRSADGKRFVKNQEVLEDFQSTGAMSALIMELITDADAASEFVAGIIPKGIDEMAAKFSATPRVTALQSAPDPEDEQQPEPEIISRDVVEKMSQEELLALGARISSGQVKIAE